MSNPSGVLAGLNLRSNNWNSINTTVPSGGCTGGDFVVVGDSVGIYFETRAAEDVGKQVSVITYAEKIVVPVASDKEFGVGDAVYMDDSDLSISDSPITGGYTVGICKRAKVNGDTYMEIEFTGALQAV